MARGRGEEVCEQEAVSKRFGAHIGVDASECRLEQVVSEQEVRCAHRGRRLRASQWARGS